MSFIKDDLLFVGEATGTFIESSLNHYFRPATPPVFRYDDYRESLLKLRDLEFRKVAFAHYGFLNSGPAYIEPLLDQLDLWIETVSYNNSLEQDIDFKKVFDEILKKDRMLNGFSKLPPDLQDREYQFSLNSLGGIYDYLNRDKNQ